MEIKENVGQRIKRLRKELGITQQELSIRVSVTSSAVGQWERGDTKGLKPENLLAVANLFKMPVEYIITGIDSDKTPSLKQSFVLYLALCKSKNICPIKNMNNFDFDKGVFSIIDEDSNWS